MQRLKKLVKSAHFWSYQSLRPPQILYTPFAEHNHPEHVDVNHIWAPLLVNWAHIGNTEPSACTRTDSFNWLRRSRKLQVQVGVPFRILWRYTATSCYSIEEVPHMHYCRAGSSNVPHVALWDLSKSATCSTLGSVKNRKCPMVLGTSQKQKVPYVALWDLSKAENKRKFGHIWGNWHFDSFNWEPLL